MFYFVLAHSHSKTSPFSPPGGLRVRALPVRLANAFLGLLQRARPRLSTSWPPSSRRSRVGCVGRDTSVPGCADQGRPVACAQYPASSPPPFQNLRLFPALGLVRIIHPRTPCRVSPSPPSLSVRLYILRHLSVCACRSAPVFLGNRSASPSYLCGTHGLDVVGIRLRSWAPPLRWRAGLLVAGLARRLPPARPGGPPAAS